MTKVYDPQYSTQVKFNIPIMLEFVEAKDLAKLNHWLNNAEPHKKMADAAYTKALSLNWIEGLDALWNSQWLTSKSFISKGWMFLVSCSSTINYANTPSEQWLYEKTFKEQHQSKAEFNNMALELVERANYHRSQYYWDMFFSKGLVLKGIKGTDIFQSCRYFRYYNERETKYKREDWNPNRLIYSPEDIAGFQSRLNDTLSGGVQLTFNEVFDVLMQEEMDLFWHIIDSPKIMMDKKDIALLAGILSIYFKSFKVFAKKEDKQQVYEDFDRILNALVGWGLTETVTFTAKDLDSGVYATLFERGHGYLSLKSFYNFGYIGNGYTAYQTQQAVTGYQKSEEITFHTGDWVFAAPVQIKTHEFKYVEFKSHEQAEARLKMKNILLHN